MLFLRNNRFDWRLKAFVIKGLLVHLGGRYKVRTSWEEDMEIPIYDIPLR